MQILNGLLDDVFHCLQQNGLEQKHIIIVCVCVYIYIYIYMENFQRLKDEPKNKSLFTFLLWLVMQDWLCLEVTERAVVGLERHRGGKALGIWKLIEQLILEL